MLHFLVGGICLLWVASALGTRGTQENGNDKASRRSCRTCQGPIHSWKTIPVSLHTARPNTHGPAGFEMSTSDLEVASRFPLVTLEKWQGDHAFSSNVCNTTGNCNNTNIFLWEEDAWIAAAKQIKAVAPKTSVVVWMDTTLIYTGWFWPPKPWHKHEPRLVNRTLNPEAGYACSTGHFRAAEFLEDPANRDQYLLRNASGGYALEPWSNCHVYDHTQPHVRQFWTDMCLDLTGSGVIDGCGVDFSATDKNRWALHTVAHIARWLHLDSEQAQAWNDGHRQLMVDTTTALEDGLLIGKDHLELGDHVNAVLQEGCANSNGTILMLQNLTYTAQRLGKRLVYQCHTKRHSINSLAAFLCGAGPDHYYSIGGWSGGSFEGHWIDEFGKPLGEPLMDCKYNQHTHIWTRVFASGTVVRYNATGRVGLLEWNDDGNAGFVRRNAVS